MNVLIVDDEKEACDNLSRILTEFVDDSINIIGTANNTIEASEKIEKLKPDAIFLDIEMPNENAFQFLQRIFPVDFEIIFVTAYDEYAIRAFKLNAVDYILKPINIEELSRAVNKLSERLTLKRLVNNYNLEELSNWMGSKDKQQQIVVRNKHEFEVIPFSNIIFLKAMGSYCSICFYNKSGEERSLVASRSIAEYEELLPPEDFFRVHKSFIANCRYVRSVIRDDQAYVSLSNGDQLPVGRRRYTELLNFLKNFDVSH
jgi:two-component system LytT family response regulator